MMAESGMVVDQECEVSSWLVLDEKLAGDNGEQYIVRAVN